MHLAALADFHLLAAAGSLGKASRQSGRPKATLSRRVRGLEESLGVRLIERGAHAWRLTAEGQALYERTAPLLRDIEHVGRNLSSGSDRPSGALRVSTPVLFSQTWGGDLAVEYCARYPDVRLELIASDRHVDLVEEGFDIAIRVNPQPDSELIGRCIARDVMLVVAPPSLPMPGPAEPGVPAKVPAVAMAAHAIESWRLVVDGRESTLRPDYRLRLSSLTMVRTAVLAGIGAALLPRSITRADIAAGTLTAWGAHPERTAELWALHSSRRLVSAKVSAFLELLVERFPDRQL